MAYHTFYRKEGNGAREEIESMNTDLACKVLSDIAGMYEGENHVKDACHFAIFRMRELDSMQKILQGIVAEFKEQP